MIKITEEQKEKIILVELISIIVLLILILFILFTKEEKKEITTDDSISILETTTATIISDEYYVDIKGAVKKPGVYLVTKGSIVNDVIKKAGGLKSNAYTGNINLSQATTESMVIYIYNTSEIKKMTTPIITNTTCSTNVIKVDNCISTTTKVTTNNEVTNNKININTATLDELMTLSGVGKSKAESIIKYRSESKFESIEDIKNVSGIGEALYDAIKDNITV